MISAAQVKSQYHLPRNTNFAIVLDRKSMPDPLLFTKHSIASRQRRGHQHELGYLYKLEGFRTALYLENDLQTVLEGSAYLLDT